MMIGVHCAQRAACIAPSGLIGNGGGKVSPSRFSSSQSLSPLGAALWRTEGFTPRSVCYFRRRSSGLSSASYAASSPTSNGGHLPVDGGHESRQSHRTREDPPGSEIGARSLASSLKHDGFSKSKLSVPGPLWTPGAWLVALLQRMGPVLAAVCLGLAWVLVKPAPAFARSQLARPLTVSSARQLSGGVKREAGGSAGGASHHNQELGSDESGALDRASLDYSTSVTSQADLSTIRGLASLSQAVQHSLASSYAAPFISERTQSPPSISEQPQSAPSDDSRPSTSESVHFSSSNDYQTATSSFQGGATNPLQDFMRNAAPGPSGFGDPLEDPDGSDGKRPKGVQAREKLDVYYLPDQIPKPKNGEWVSDQGPFIEPDWITTRVNDIVNKLKVDTGTELVVVAVNALGKHAGVPEMVATELCQQWQVGGPKGDGLLFLYVNKGGSSWEKLEGGEIEMDVPYKRQLAVKILPGLEAKLDKWGAKTAQGGKNARGSGPPTAQDIVGEVREVVRAKMATGKCTFGEVMLEGIAGMGEKVWAAEGKRPPSKMRVDPTAAKRRENVEWVTVALTVFLVWSWADKGNRLSNALQQVYPWLVGSWARLTKRPGPVCDACGKPTALRGKANLEEIKDAGARKEAEVGSIGYYAYVCENLDCKAPLEERVNLVKWNRPFRAKRCPGCRYWTVKQTAQPLQKAGLFRDGVVKRVVECQQCGVRGERVMRDPSFVRGLRVWEPQMVDVEIGRSTAGGILDSSSDGGGEAGGGSRGAIQPAGS